MSKTGHTGQYRRVLLKISGEMLCADQGSGISPDGLATLCQDIQTIRAAGVELAVVIGAGNLCRGTEFAKLGFDQVSADHMGMLATIMNAIALSDALNRAGVDACVRSSRQIDGIVQAFQREEAAEQLASGRVVVLAGGTGNPLVTTDTAAALRAIELGVDVLFKATKVEGVYSADPKQNPTAQFYSRLSYDQVLQENLNVMDLAAMCLCRDHRMPIQVFKMDKPNIYQTILFGTDEGTRVDSGE